MKVTYPVIFTRTDTNILIEVPDLRIMTEANEDGAERATLADAISMARDAIGIRCITDEDDGISVKPASDMSEIDIASGTFAGEGSNYLSLVDVDLSEYRKKLDNKVVRRNVTLPNWLNREADKAGINVSKVLQDALAERLTN